MGGLRCGRCCCALEIDCSRTRRGLPSLELGLRQYLWAIRAGMDGFWVATRVSDARFGSVVEEGKKKFKTEPGSKVSCALAGWTRLLSVEPHYVTPLGWPKVAAGSRQPSARWRSCPSATAPRSHHKSLVESLDRFRTQAERSGGKQWFA